MDAIFDFSYFPILKTEHLRLRQLTYDDADSLIAIFGDPQVLRYLSGDPPCNTRKEAVKIIDWMQSWFYEKGGLRWGITLRGDDKVIGTCGFHFLSRENRHCDIGYDLQPAYWGRGYVTEATHAMVRWCFENLDLHRIQADCTAGNIGSERVLEKVGFTHEGTWRENCFEHERFISLKQYGLLRREYLPESSAL
jgi:ribosomal-protein-alanine N-acetyltransferase